MLGHEAVAIDIPGHGERVDEEATMDGRLDAVLDVLRPGDVLVGHSGGGLEITRAADAAPDLVAHVIYLAAALPLEGRLIQDALTYRDDGGTEGDYDVTGMLEHLRFGDDGSMAFADVEGAKELFFHDCDDATALWAFERLTPERAGDTATTPISVKGFWEADLPRSFIVCLQDQAQPRWLADVTARRLGVEPLAIDASHSPFLSRPAELAQLLVKATTTKPVGPLKPKG
jgi:pimeloyl-ACP methyl ester carboxylesterase